MKKLENKEKYNTKHENRTETILVKVTPTEQEQIKRRAEDAGYSGKVSPYIRSQALCPCADPSAGRLRQEIATLLCQHAQLVAMINDPEIQPKFIEWGKTVWQSLKL